MMTGTTEGTDARRDGDRKNVFVLGLDELNLRWLHHVHRSDRCRFYSLLDAETARGDPRRDYPFDEVLEQATRDLEAFGGPVDALLAFWDYPVNPMAALLARRFGTTAPSPEAIARCEHKYWSRVVQAEVIDALPRFASFDPRGDAPLESIRHLGFPLWIKPVTGTGSVLGFRVDDADDFEAALPHLRREVPRLAGGFHEMLSHLEVPPEIAAMDGYHCMAETLVPGRQCTVSGYTYGDEVTTYGVVDSFNFPGSSSFQRYEYPSELPPAVQERMETLSRRVIRHTGLTDATFNVEFFYEPDGGELHLLEVNPRMSPSHGLVYEMVDGLPNHELLVDLALGKRPTWHPERGPWERSAKIFLRSFMEDARALRVPSGDEVAALEQEFEGTRIEVKPRLGQRLSTMTWQEPHSYELAHVFVGADERDELLHKYERIEAALEPLFELLPLDIPAEGDGSAGEGGG